VRRHTFVSHFTYTMLGSACWDVLMVIFWQNACTIMLAGDPDMPPLVPVHVHAPSPTPQTYTYICKKHILTLLMDYLLGRPIEFLHMCLMILTYWQQLTFTFMIWNNIG
jgi:hypothetical protein